MGVYSTIGLLPPLNSFEGFGIRVHGSGFIVPGLVLTLRGPRAEGVEVPDGESRNSTTIQVFELGSGFKDAYSPETPKYPLSKEYTLNPSVGFLL